MIAQFRQPFVIVEHDGIGRAVAEGQEFLEDALDAGDVLGDPRFGQQGALGVLEGGVAHLGRAAAHQDDGLVPGLLQTAQQHDLDQVADVQRRRRGVKADIAGDDPAGRRLVQLGRMGDLMDIAPRLHGAEEVGFENVFGHGGGSVSRDADGRLPFPYARPPQLGLEGFDS
jgi:hypothetical protein